MKVLVNYSNNVKVKELSINSPHEQMIFEKMTKRSEFHPIVGEYDEAKYSLTLDYYNFWQSVCEAYNQVFEFANELLEQFESDIINTIVTNTIKGEDISEAAQIIYYKLSDYFIENSPFDIIKIRSIYDDLGEKVKLEQATSVIIGLTYNSRYIPANYKEAKVSKGRIEIFIKCFLDKTSNKWLIEDYKAKDYQFYHNRKELFAQAGWSATENSYLSNILDNTRATNGKTLPELINDFLNQQFTLIVNSPNGYEKIKTIGLHVWGYSWQKELAKAIGYKSAGNIRAWQANGNVPASAYPKIKEALREHARKVNELADTL